MADPTAPDFSTHPEVQFARQADWVRRADDLIDRIGRAGADEAARLRVALDDLLAAQAAVLDEVRDLAAVALSPSLGGQDGAPVSGQAGGPPSASQGEGGRVVSTP